MGRNSKFLNILRENSKYIEEDRFVKRDEDSELPSTGGDGEREIPSDDEPTGPVNADEIPDDGDQQERDDQEDQSEPNVFTSREKDILNVAVQIYRANPQNPISYKNEFSNMLENGRYEELLGRLISVADELLD